MYKDLPSITLLIYSITYVYTTHSIGQFGLIYTKFSQKCRVSLRPAGLSSAKTNVSPPLGFNKYSNVKKMYHL